MSSAPLSHSTDADVPVSVRVARALLQAYVEQDRQEAEALIATTLRFTSPQDDHIDRQAYFDRCFPTADRLKQQTLLYSAELDVQNAVIVYEYELRGGGRYRNTEIITVQDGQATEIQVFFGGQIG